jgi:hypothetical protein
MSNLHSLKSLGDLGCRGRGPAKSGRSERGNAAGKALIAFASQSYLTQMHINLARPFSAAGANLSIAADTRSEEICSSARRPEEQIAS